ncbi:uncharacterized protein LOC134067300 [Sardina pilchardus]|uniref:uncharacterized protein LOC134067300 n=1 Tax=Sardina pilchardus TaxID=27697 RepID=UPI002E109C2C
MMICSAYAAALLLAILQTASESTASCFFPTLLCCPGRDDSCYRNGCYCDVYCLTATDCCSDYNQTCNSSSINSTTEQPTTFALTTEDSTSTTISSSQSPTSSSKSVTTQEPLTTTQKQTENTITTEQLATPALTTKDSTSTTSPLTSSKSPSSSSNSETAEEQKQEDPTRVLMKVRGYLHPRSEDETVQEALQRLVLSLENTFKEQCGECAVRILKLKAITDDS